MLAALPAIDIGVPRRAVEVATLRTQRLPLRGQIGARLRLRATGAEQSDDADGCAECAPALEREKTWHRRERYAATGDEAIRKAIATRLDGATPRDHDSPPLPPIVKETHNTTET